ncbi:hypothetical protein PsAD2_03360 [Pseudovibrio axinellae]|uniref:N-acetyltransferase domain-containing protein n=1 Tax=Pseudovibrio axinellae TaxID=989403 RepID=A0A165WNX2_9HYPH|nr:GNAT family N-acetyltransferase [Pseudovibrio axinellae]KZL16743.1 hypothetical protein PsAD2_03360 [Pseudovibrio axinellae]SEQ76446.1 Predicted acetyltransferase [Pseudovibrio axinellae]
MSVKLQGITLADKPILVSLFQLYLYEMSKSVGLEVADNGKFDYDPEIINAYFNRPEHHPYFILHNNRLAGFALVRRYPHDTRLIDMGQFFVLRAHMRQGVGRAAFDLCVRAHAGQWQVRVLPENVPAQTFWKSAVSELTGGTYAHETSSYQGKDMIFITFAC